MEADITRLAAGIRVLLMDVDGVLTDGRYYQFPGPNGTMVETKGFDSRDGIAMHWMHRVGIEGGMITGRASEASRERARSGMFKYYFEGQTEKIPMINEIIAKSKVDASQIAYIGDDFTDVVVMRRVGLGIATANARPEVKAAAHYVTEAAGGCGALREVVELILKAQGRWEEILRHYEIY